MIWAMLRPKRLVVGWQKPSWTRSTPVPWNDVRKTAAAIAVHYEHLSVQAYDAIGEVRYGAWQGKKLSHLRRKKLWGNVQHFPTRVRFPEGETMRGAQARAVDGVEALQSQHPRQTIALVSHSDVIKMIVAHYLGVHLDLFQRINVSPASITTLILGNGMPFIYAVNDTSHNPKSRGGIQEKLIHARYRN